MDLSKHPGSWSLITGASAGIGREFAHQIAALGWHVALVARREGLEQLATEIREKNQVEVLTIRQDLAEHRAVDQLRQTLDAHGIRPRLICNNAAAGHVGPFEERSPAEYARMIQLNATAMVEICSAFRTDLLSFPSSAIINVSSQAAYQPIPYMAVYAATKAFVHSFSQAISYELKDHGVVVQTLVPGPTATEFDAKYSNHELKVAARGTPAEVVQASLASLRGGSGIASNASGLLKQRLAAALIPPKFLLREVAKMFCPPSQGPQQ